MNTREKTKHNIEHISDSKLHRNISLRQRSFKIRLQLETNKLKKELPKYLRLKASGILLEKINAIQSNSNHSDTLNFRNLELDSSDVLSIMEIVTQSNANKFIKSISFSYNRLIGDDGTITILNTLSNTVNEIGLVDCGIGDRGGKIILKKIKNLTNLKMLCIEQNNFSDPIKQEFKTFSSYNPQVLIVV